MAGAGGVYTGGNATVIMDPPSVVYVKVFHTGSGPDRHLRAKAEKVAILARVLVPKSTGRLAATIRVDQNRNERGHYAFGFAVSAGTPYGYYVHEGTGPSPRWPDSRKAMKWHGREGDFPVRDFVMHPGTPKQPFLQDALIAMAD